MGRPSDDPKSSKQNKARKKQIKVVYISNPMKVKTTAAEFKSLVQELTGRDSHIADRLSMSAEMEITDEGAEEASERAVASGGGGSLVSTACPGGFSNDGIDLLEQQQQPQRVPYTSNGTPFDALGDVFTPQILDDLASFMSSPSNYESSPPDGGNTRNLSMA